MRHYAGSAEGAGAGAAVAAQFGAVMPEANLTVFAMGNPRCPPPPPPPPPTYPHTHTHIVYLAVGAVAPIVVNLTLVIGAAFLWRRVWRRELAKLGAPAGGPGAGAGPIPSVPVGAWRPPQPRTPSGCACSDAVRWTCARASPCARNWRVQSFCAEMYHHAHGKLGGWCFFFHLSPGEAHIPARLTECACEEEGVGVEKFLTDHRQLDHFFFPRIPRPWPGCCPLSLVCCAALFPSCAVVIQVGARYSAHMWTWRWRPPPLP